MKRFIFLAVLVLVLSGCSYQNYALDIYGFEQYSDAGSTIIDDCYEFGGVDLIPNEYTELGDSSLISRAKRVRTTYEGKDYELECLMYGSEGLLGLTVETRWCCF